jgi:hypothetical protein
MILADFRRNIACHGRRHLRGSHAMQVLGFPCGWLLAIAGSVTWDMSSDARSVSGGTELQIER